MSNATHVPPMTEKLVELFTGPLRDVRFPDADLERLTRAVDEVEEAHRALVQAELALGAAREALAEKREAVTKQSERSLAYARVYAAERPELLAALDALAATKPAPRRARAPKDEAAPMTSTETVPKPARATRRGASVDEGDTKAHAAE